MADYTSYDINVIGPNQIVEIVLHYPDEIEMGDPSPTINYTLTGAGTPRNVLVSTSGSDFIIKLDPGAAGYVTVLQALISVQSDMAGVTMDEEQVDPIQIDSDGDSVVCLGEDVCYINGGSTASVRILTPVNGNGMIHFGIYAQDRNDLVPIGQPVSPIRINTYTAFIDTYQGLDAAGTAKIIVSSINSSNPPPARYTLTINANDPTQIDVTDIQDEQTLYVYIVDYRLLENYPVTLMTLQADGGVLMDGPWEDMDCM
jgi:hypothetical protein